MKKRQRELTDKQKRFAIEYAVDFNATQAAIRAGYSKNGAAVTANKLLINANIKAAIKLQVDKGVEKAALSKEWVLSELGKIYKSMREGKNEKDKGAASVALKSLEQICKLMGYNTEEDNTNNPIVALQINVKDVKNEA